MGGDGGHGSAEGKIDESVNASSASTPTSLLFQNSNNKEINMDAPKFNFLNKAKVLIAKSLFEEEKVLDKKAATSTQQP
jgi:hypothetical protein